MLWNSPKWAGCGADGLRRYYQIVSGRAILQLRYIDRVMSDVNEIRALKASLRGAIDTAQNLAAVQEKVEALDDHGEPGADFLQDLARVSAAQAVASAALRGLLDMMLKRREAA